jgi:hypothetical protein
VQWPLYVSNLAHWRIATENKVLPASTLKMKRSLREILIDSHVALTTIAVLLLWSMDGAFWGLWPLLSRAAQWLLIAIAIRDIPYFSITTAERSIILISAMYFYAAIVSFLAASILSRWVYGVGPLRSLVACGNKLPHWRQDV